MADPLSITSGCAGLLAAIASATICIHEFVRTIREAQSDLNGVSRELASLGSVLELIRQNAADGATSRPILETISRHLSGIISNCNVVVADIERLLENCGNDGATATAEWALSGRGDMDKLRSSLEAHTSALSLASDMISLYGWPLALINFPSLCIVKLPYVRTSETSANSKFGSLTGPQRSRFDKPRLRCARTWRPSN
jgi:STAND-like protein